HVLPRVRRRAGSCLPELRRRARRAPEAPVSARHLYVHLPFCSSRCGYCDFVTVVGRDGEHDAYVEALVAELALERHLPDARRAFAILREAGFDNLSLDLIYGVPGQSRDDLARDLDDALALGPEHISAYELEAKPGSRFTHAHGVELERQAEAMEAYFEAV